MIIPGHAPDATIFNDDSFPVSGLETTGPIASPAEAAEAEIPDCVRRPETWIGRGACLGATAADLFFPQDEHETKSEAQERNQRAKNVCNTECQVRDECLAKALYNRSHDGVLGGTTDSERRKIISWLVAVGQPIPVYKHY